MKRRNSLMPEVVRLPADPMPVGPALDVHGSMLRLGELFCKNALEPALGGRVKLWENGGREFADVALGTLKAPRGVTARDVAAALGILPRRSR